MSGKPKCRACGEKFKNVNRLRSHCDHTGHERPGWLKKMEASPSEPAEEVGGVDWDGECESCGASPTVGGLGLCGPCCFGEADTAGGNW